MRFVGFVILLCVCATVAVADIRTGVQELFTRDMETIDLARVKIEVDRMVDPSINIDGELAQIDQMVTAIKGMLPPNADSWAKVEAIRRYIYQTGPWNGGRAFSYDHDDPYGLDVRNRLLSDILMIGAATASPCRSCLSSWANGWGWTLPPQWPRCMCW